MIPCNSVFKAVLQQVYSHAWDDLPPSQRAINIPFLGSLPTTCSSIEKGKLASQKYSNNKDLYQQEDDRRRRQKKKEEEAEE
eukprot:10214385-Ditylum_brightwellii.AAC.1